MKSPIAVLAIVVAATLTAASAPADVFNMSAGQTSLQFVTVGDPGNAGEQSAARHGDPTYYGAVATRTRSASTT